MSSDGGGSIESDNQTNHVGPNQEAPQPIEPTLISPETQDNVQDRPKNDRLQKLQLLQAQAKLRITFQLTLKDELKILFQNLLEPFLVALVLVCSVTLVQIGTFVYFTLTIFVLYPLLLTLHETRIQVKLGLSVAIAVIAPSVTLMKAWVYCQFTETAHVNSNPELIKAIGIYQGQWTKTFLVDILVFVFAGLLITCYYFQINQARLRSENQNNLRFQYGINLVHPCLGKWLKTLIITAYSFMLLDTFFYQSMIQTVILLIILVYVYNFSHGKRIVLSDKVLRVLQGSLYVVLLVAVLLRFPGVVVNDKSRALQIIGVETLTVQTTRQQWYLGIHWFLISFSLTQSEAFFVMQRAVKPKKTQYMEVIGEQRNSILKKDRLDTEIIDDDTVVVMKSARSKKQKGLSLADYWAIFKLPFLLWVCRICCFLQICRYHSWQSLVALLWVLHSALFQNRARFCKVTVYVYLPMLCVVYLWYFVTNVYGVIDYTQWEDDGDFPRYWQFGFYYMKNPELDFAGLFVCVTSIALYCRLNKFDHYKKRSLLINLQRYEPLLYSWYYLAIVNLVYLVQLYAVIFGLITTDLYHIFVLAAMVLAQFHEQAYKRHAVWLVAYVNFFILAKFITSLVQKSGDNPYNLVIGFSSTYYEPATETREFYRYVPPAPSYVLLFAFALQYRCFQSLGNDEKLIETKINSASDVIARRQQYVYKTYKWYKILENHTVVIVTFLLFIIIILLMRRSFINAGSLLIVFILLARYLQSGLKALLTSWSVITFYQAAVLLTLLSVHFILYSQANSSLNYTHLTDKWKGLSPYTKALWQYAGFYEFSNQAWKVLFPYVFLFFYAIMVKSKFEQKLFYEEADVSSKPKEDDPHNSLLVWQDDDGLKNREEDPDDLSSQQLQAARKREQQFEIESKYLDMSFKMQYVIWKTKKYWPIFDSVSLNFNIVFITYVLVCALYYSIAGIWFLFMLIFVLQNWSAQRAHRQYQKNEKAKFMQKPNEFQRGPNPDPSDRLVTSAGVARYEKLETQLLECKDRETKDLLKHQMSQAEANLDEQMRTRITDEEAIDEYSKYMKEVKYVTLPARHYFWMTQFYLTILATFCIYISAFLVTPVQVKTDNGAQEVTLIPADWNQSKVIFIFFWSGFYQQAEELSLSGGSFFRQYWAFFVLLYLLISEKLSQQWLTDRFRTTDALINQFKELTEQYKALNTEPDKSVEAPPEVSDQQKLLKELTPRLSIKYQLNTLLSLRFLIDEIAMTLIFFSMVYKENIYSFVLFGVIVFFLIVKFRNKGNATVAARYTVVTLILVQYSMALTNLTSYNSPRDFPTTLTNSTLPDGRMIFTVYPNVDQMYYSVPWYFNVTEQTYFDVDYNQTVPLINTDVCNFFGISVSGRTLNGLWIDFFVVVLMYIYLNNAGLWLLEIPFKVISSEKTLELVDQYQTLQNGQIAQPATQFKHQILASMSVTRRFKVIQQYLLINWGLLVIAFLMLCCVAGQSLVSFGYFLFSMVLVILQFNFYKYPEGRDRQISLLKYFLIPYILLDVFTTLLYQMPLQNFTQNHEWIKYLGLQKIWTYQTDPDGSPTLYLGQVVGVQMDYFNHQTMAYLFLRGVLYFFIAVQLQILSSKMFLKLFDKQLCGSANKHYKVALGTAYRFNNLKNQKLREQSASYSQIDNMLKKVKTLLKFKAMAETPQEVEANPEQTFKEEFEKEIPQLYAKNFESLNLLMKGYVYLNANFVNEMLFSHTDEHLSFLLTNYEQGHITSKTRLEIALMIDTKKAWLKNKQTLLQEQLSVGVISQTRMEEFLAFQETVSFKVEPWQMYRQDDYRSFWKLVRGYCVVLYKILMSNLQYVCYFFMILSLMQNGGLLFMVYPALVFGIALVEESRPGKTFWYFVMYYTQALLTLQILAQLNIFNRSDLDGTSGSFFTWCLDHNFGILSRTEYTGSYSSVFWKLFPQLMLLITTLVTIQYETIAGIFDVDLYDYEQFTDSLKRISKNNSTPDTTRHIENIERTELLSAGIQLLPETRKRSLSESDKNRADKMPKLMQKLLSRQIDSTVIETELNLVDELLTQPIKVDYRTIEKRRCKSLEFKVQAVEEYQRLNLLQQGMKEAQQMTEVLWSNSLFNRLFPSIKQQKPGADFYAWTMFFSVCILLQVIFFTQKMSGEDSSISLQFSGNQINGEMVLAMICVIVIMVVDRVFYSTEMKANRKIIDQKLGTDKGLDHQSSGQEGGASFHDWLTVPQYQGLWPKRVLRYYWLCFLLIIVHWYIFFWLTDLQKVCYGNPYCNPFTQNGYLITFYIFFCVYFALSAVQIRTGLPELKKGGLFVDHYDALHKTAYYIWYYIPFLFELRTIIDWTFIKTSLDVFQSIELAKIQSDLYIAKCFNRPYMAHKLGAKITWIEKVAIGLSLMLFILFLIAGPMLLFSTINPISQSNLVSESAIQFSIKINDMVLNTTALVPLFYSSSLVKNKTLTTEQFDEMDFDAAGSASSLFANSQCQAIQYSKMPDTVWRVSPPKRLFLEQTLTDIAKNITSMKTATAQLSFAFIRATSSSAVAEYQYNMNLNLADSGLLQNLTSQLNCELDAPIAYFPMDVNLAIGLNQKKYASQLQQVQPVVSGFSLRQYCMIEDVSQNYWMIEQQFPAPPPNTTDIFNAAEGFGIFTFNQNVLPDIFAEYSSSVFVFYIAFVYVIASAFRSAFVPYSYRVYIANAPQTEDILMICQSIYIYRVQRNLLIEEELFMILVDVMRSPETIKRLTKTSLKETEQLPPPK